MRLSFFQLTLVPLIFFQIGLHFREEAGKVSLYDGDDLVFSYQVETKSYQGQYPRANYVHPLNDFQGAAITEDFPADHLHQRGIFWAWHQLYLNGTSVADPWICEGIAWKVYNVRHEVKEGRALISATVDWLVGEDQQNLVQEQVEIAYQGKTDHYLMEFDITLTSQVDGVGIGGSDDSKGYGGFSPRLVLGDEVTFADAAGTVTPQNDQVQAGNWVLVRDIGPNESEVVIMYHPESTMYLKGWILRAKGSMQNPVWPGRELVVLNKGESVEMKAAIVVFRGEATKRQVEKIYQNYLDQ
jgi:hypothetical protein